MAPTHVFMGTGLYLACTRTRTHTHTHNYSVAINTPGPSFFHTITIVLLDNVRG